MKKILLFDTSIGTDNVGDNIIMDYCQQQLMDIFKNELYWFEKVPTHLEIGKTAYYLNKGARHSFVCGTNILKTTILKKRIWKIGIAESLKLKDLTLMGVGWNNYNKFNIDPYTKLIYKSLFSKNILHSVRDEYTKQKLHEIGIDNVINTACPTMWKLTTQFCQEIPQTKSRQVITALTCYKPDAEKDKYMFDVLNKNYEKIYLWIQQAGDYEYFLSLGLNYPIEIIRPLLPEFDNMLKCHDLDFIGSRLHGGIRALNYKRRTLIIGVDNRAKEINRDTNLPYLDRENIENLDSWINKRTETMVLLPEDSISEWKSQYYKL